MGQLPQSSPQTLPSCPRPPAYTTSFRLSWKVQLISLFTDFSCYCVSKDLTTPTHNHLSVLWSGCYPKHSSTWGSSSNPTMGFQRLEEGTPKTNLASSAPFYSKRKYSPVTNWLLYKKRAMLGQRGGVPYIPEINTADAGLTDRKMCPCFSSVFFRITRIKWINPPEPMIQVDEKGHRDDFCQAQEKT